MRILRLMQFLMLIIALSQISACVTNSSTQRARPATTQFDGKWNALMKSDQLPCADTYQYVVAIKNGEMSGTVRGVLNDFDLAGQVMADGSVKDMKASSSNRLMTFKGKFMDSVAEGTFLTYGVSTNCGGTFEFTRQN